MSARDDYPLLTRLSTHSYFSPDLIEEEVLALDEIDRLRAAVALLRTEWDGCPSHQEQIDGMVAP